MRQIHLALFIFSFFFCCCQTEQRKALPKEDISSPFPLVIDSIGIEKFIFLSEYDTQNRLTEDKYLIFYIGLPKDTIYLNPFISYTPPPPPPPPPPSWTSAAPAYSQDTTRDKNINYKRPDSLFSKYWVDYEDNRNYKFWEEAEIELRVDTLKNISGFYPVLITNMDTDTSFIGYGKYIPIRMEALDPTGHWILIKKHFLYGCGFGVPSIFLPPKECVLSLVLIPEGEFKTQIRLTMGKNHSAAFYGFIDYKQFNLKNQ